MVAEEKLERQALLGQPLFLPAASARWTNFPRGKLN